MIQRAVDRAAGDPRLHFLIGDGLRLPFADGKFDACTIVFGLRNMEDFDVALREMHRVIRPDGRSSAWNSRR
jgi:demethylmenaquinone methyltransferase/2-methoxy-6-polyprenyl-1,4-benzoquinol methylase